MFEEPVCTKKGHKEGSTTGVAASQVVVVWLALRLICTQQSFGLFACSLTVVVNTIPGLRSFEDEEQRLRG